MSAVILFSEPATPEIPFDLQGRAFNFVCQIVGETARRNGLDELAKWCNWAVQDGILNFIHMPDELAVIFGKLLHELLGNGAIIHEMLTWPIALQDYPDVLAENRTAAVLSYVNVAGVVPTLWRLADYLMHREHVPEKPSEVSKKLSDLVCATVGQAAKRQGLSEVIRICEHSANGGTFTIDEASDEAKAAFGLLLREAVNDGRILREMYTWAVPEIDTSSLSPGHRTPQVIAFLYIHSQTLALRHLTIQLDRYAKIKDAIHA